MGKHDCTGAGAQWRRGVSWVENWFWLFFRSWFSDSDAKQKQNYRWHQNKHKHKHKSKPATYQPGVRWPLSCPQLDSTSFFVLWCCVVNVSNIHDTCTNTNIQTQTTTTTTEITNTNIDNANAPSACIKRQCAWYWIYTQIVNKSKRQENIEHGASARWRPW